MSSLLVKALTFASDAVADVSIDFLLNQVRHQFALLSSFEKPISELRKTLKRIRCVLLDAEERRNIEEESVKTWLSELKTATYDAEDVLDRYDTLRKLNNKIKVLERHNPPARHSSDETSSSAKRSRVNSSSSFSFFLKSVFAQLDQNKHFDEDIVRIEKKLDEIAEGRKSLRLVAGDSRRRGNDRKGTHTGHVPVKGEAIVGRDKEKQFVVSQLLSEKAGMQHHPSVVPIWGVAGIGKTTLANLVYNDVEVKNFFDLLAWVSVPDGRDVAGITKEIIKAIRHRKVDSVSFNVLQFQLMGLLRNKKFLLVLDELWVTDSKFWDDLLPSLQGGLMGSKVLLTCRNSLVFTRMPLVCEPINLKGLDETSCWELLCRQASLQRNQDAYFKLEKIGREIVNKCGGSPLVAKSLGNILCKQTDMDYWTNLREEMWALAKQDDPVHHCLMISYRHLSYELKRCFVYCSVFPNGNKFDKDELVRLWIAEGLVSLRATLPLEDIGGEYFDELCRKSFFEMHNKDEPKYKMPSLMHDLACLLSKSESLIFENNEPKVHSDYPEALRYASIIHRESKDLELDKLYEYRNLRTVAIFGGDTRVSLRAVPEDLCDNLRCIRVLNLSNSEVKRVPISIGNLLHLRYLGLRKTKIKRLPETVCNLYNLQTMDLSECYDFEKLPNQTSNLVNLRHIILSLDWNKITVMESMPPRIGSMTSLTTLSRFTVTSDCDNGSNICELKALKLRKELCLSKLEYVCNAKDAEEVNLVKKQYIEKLLLQWSENLVHFPINRSPCEEVAKALCPQPKLKILCFKDYPGSKFPDWLGDERFKFLETLTLSGCKNCLVFPTLGKLPQLKNLHAENMDYVVSMGEAFEFPALETLTIGNMPNLENWFKAEADLFPKLQKLELVNCPKLTELKHLPPTLEPRIVKCNRLVYPPVYFRSSCGI